MSMQLVMSGKKELSLIHEDDVGIHDYVCVLNYNFCRNYAYYVTEKMSKEIIQNAVRNARKDVTHVLYLSSGITLNNGKYLFDKEKEFDMVTDDADDWKKRKAVLIKVTDDTRANIDNVDTSKVTVFDSDIINYESTLDGLTQQLLKNSCDFNRSVGEIRSLKTHLERVEKPRIFIGTPCFGAQVSCNFTSSLIKTIELLKEQDIYCEIHFLPNQIVTRARNILAYNFLHSSCSHLLFIDADIEWTPHDVLKLINHKKELCVGLYANKAYIDTKTTNTFKKLQYSSTFFAENNTMDKNKLMEIKHGATGFMLIAREVFNKVKDLAPEYKYAEATMNDFFPCKVVNGDYLTEDYAFCQMWREKGGKIWADLSICLNHEGWHSFHGNPLETFSVENN